MRLYTQLLTRNACYIAGRRLAPRGVMVHSTGANNPLVARYVPGDAILGRNTGGNHWDQSNREWRKKYGKNLDKCVHAFIGQLADGSVGTVQTLPWDMRGWHTGHTRGNDRYIGFEICEDGLTDPVYFNAVYREAVELTAYLCRRFKLDPMADGVVICHREGNRRGIASNHGDVLHWFPRHGKSMDDFRADVARELREEDEMTQEQFDTMMEDWMARRAAAPADDWAKPHIRRAIDADLMTDVGGTIARPKDFVTRQELAVVAANLAEG